VGDLLDLGVQPDHIRGQIADRPRAGVATAAASALASSRQSASTRALRAWLVRITECPWAGAAQTAAASPSACAAATAWTAAPHAGGGGCLRRAGHYSLLVVRGLWIGVEGERVRARRK
jgi:hypothetical protein